MVPVFRNISLALAKGFELVPTDSNQVLSLFLKKTWTNLKVLVSMKYLVDLSLIALI